MRRKHYSLQGTIAGTLWQGTEGEKDFSFRFEFGRGPVIKPAQCLSKDELAERRTLGLDSPWHGCFPTLQSVLDYAANDGDFEAAWIDRAILCVQDYPNSRTAVEYTFPLIVDGELVKAEVDV